jgi:hypothetical protein
VASRNLGVNFICESPSFWTGDWWDETRTRRILVSNCKTEEGANEHLQNTQIQVFYQNTLQSGFYYDDNTILAQGKIPNLLAHWHFKEAANLIRKTSNQSLESKNWVRRKHNRFATELIQNQDFPRNNLELTKP